MPRSQEDAHEDRYWSHRRYGGMRQPFGPIVIPLWQRSDVLVGIAHVTRLWPATSIGSPKGHPQLSLIPCLYTSFGGLLISSKALGSNFIYMRS